ncbi:hypothetical protein [Leclercia adecarboxylata]|uniref:hypothetical protein n=1 Tax=Leclercia adecarboxylata TaxID=83655 RepID=UPI00244B74C6|nr:hypothetical protein [Leclercia adecarboxylata]MDH0061014.1 hypothetical protein [Leclercia adecarboxylata]
MMNIRFNPEVFVALREAATRKGMSIPALVNSIVTNNILKQEELNEPNKKSNNLR